MNKLIVICGPTATGKSALAVQIAKEFHGEIISADSRQVYKGLDIGSAKILPHETEGIPHHLIDVADPTDVFTVSQFQSMTHEIIEGIYTRGKIPILCGGTGMYISAVIDGIGFPEVPPNLELRQELEKMSIDQLVLRLEELDPRRASEIDRKNPVRLIRAIEIAETLGSIPSLNHDHSRYQALSIGLEIPKEQLTHRIHQRIEARIPALFDEIKNLNATGVSFERLHAFGLEYRYGSEYVQGNITLPEFIELLATKTWQFAKRQLTWFKANLQIHWFNPEFDQQKILNMVQNFLK
jgi:tRNA dimethylallyltransferase